MDNRCMLILVVVLALGANLSSLVEAVDNSRIETYERINTWLENKVKSYDLKANINAIKAHSFWLKTFNWIERADFNFHYYFTSEIGQLARVYDSLGPKNQCDWFIAEKLSFPAGILKLKYSLNPKEEFNRLGWLIYTIASQHSKECKDFWPKQFKNVYPTFNTTIIEIVEEFIGDSVAKKPEMNNREYMEWLIDDAAYSPSLYEKANEYVKEKSKNDPDQKDFEEMMYKYLKYPCGKYQYHFGYKITGRAEFGAKFFEGKSGYILDDDSLVQFYRSMALSRICDAFIMHENLVTGRRKLALVEERLKSDQESAGLNE